jgi:hypothetical protein
LTFVMISVLGIIAKSISFGIVIGASTLFFIISNLGVWYFYYPHTWIGLSSCFILAIPFFINSLMGDFFYTFLLQFSFNKLNQSYFTIVK